MNELSVLVKIILLVMVLIAIVELGRFWLRASSYYGGEKGISTHKLIWWRLRSLFQKPVCDFCSLSNTPVWGGKCEVCDDERRLM